MELIKIKKFLLFSLVVLAVSSCRSVSFNDLHSQNENVNKLPALRVNVDKESLKNAYPVRKVTTGSGTETNDGTLNFYGSVSSYKQDSRARDVITVINYDVRNNIANSTGKLKGKFNVRLSNVNNEYNAAYYPLTALQTITLYIPSLLGAPIAEQNCSVELEVEIQNNHQEVVASYTEVGQGSAKVAAYYGYTGEEASRYCTIQAIQSAMDKVKLNIAEDYARINKALQK